MSLFCGSAKVEITPPIGTHLTGDVVRRREAVGIADPLYTKVAWFERDGRKLCIVALDVTIVNEPYTSQIRERAKERFGIDPDAVMVHATQTHSAPTLGDFLFTHIDLEPQHHWIRGDNPAWSAEVVDKTIAAMELARTAMKPVRIGWCRTLEGRLAFNRRMIKRDGHAMMPGRGWLKTDYPQVASHLEGPIDPDLALMPAKADDGQIIAVLAHYTAHPVHVFPERVVSADWPGTWSHQLSQALGPACTPVVLNGCCGDVNPWDPWDEHYPNDHHRMGRLLMESSRRAMTKVTWSDDATLDWKIEHVDIPLRELDPEALAAARVYMTAHPQPSWPPANNGSPDWDWARSAMLVGLDNMRREHLSLRYEIQVLRIGDVAVVGLPGEPFAEGALRIKAASPAKLTITAHCTSHYVGYIPTARAFPAGGHEVNHSSWAKLLPEALDMVVDGATATLRRLFRA